jgi:hypothetical protein
MGIYQDQVIEAAFLHTKPGVFYIGPFARRVSFSSQQHRALDLIAALKSKQKLIHSNTRKPKLVAVVGAGVAGITLASALRGEGCGVHLYEREEEPLILQSKAVHRLIHPTIARWPDGEIELTTKFSFLDWFATTADNVIGHMRREWNELLSPKPDDKDFIFLNNVTVTQIHADKRSVRLQVSTERNDVRPPRYDYVFVTTGFAEEETLDGHSRVSYWDDDKIDEWRHNQKPVIVSGCGDGGLIDALRLIHNDFDRGWLAIRLAEILKGRFDEEILDAESHALMAAKSLACMDLSDTSGASTAGPADRKIGARYENDDIVAGLRDFYQNLVKRLPAEALALLDTSIETAAVQVGKVTLISRQIAPYGPYAAPIHKIMIAHGIEFGPLLYRPGELRVDGNRTFIDWTIERTCEEITSQIGMVVRHGSPANLAGLASLPESHSLRIRQFMLADYIDPSIERILRSPSDYPDRVSQLSRFIGFRQPMAAELVDAIMPGATVSANATGYVFEPPLLAPIDRKPVGVRMPGRLFDLDLRQGEIIDIEYLG